MLDKVKKIFKFYLPSLFKVEILRHYPRLYSYLKFKPDSATLNITDSCCFKCLMCKQWKNTNRAEELPTDEWCNILIQLKDEGIKKISISGGEPLLRDDLINIVSFAKHIGLGITILTNGYLMSMEKAKELVSAGVNFISISVDATDDNFNHIRGLNGAYNKIEETLTILSELSRKNGLGVSMSFVLMKPTLKYLKDVLVLRDRFNFPLVINLIDFTPYFFQIEDKNNLWIRKENKKDLLQVLELLLKKIRNKRGSLYLNYSALNYIKDYFVDPVQASVPCFISQKRICIDSKGNVFGGCWSMGSFGNLREKSLSEIIESKKYQEAHRKMFFKQCPGCSCGYLDNLRVFLPKLMEESLYYLPFIRKIQEKKLYRRLRTRKNG